VKEKLYIETSVISYLCARPSRDLMVAAKQKITAEWWTTQRNIFECYVSQVVVDEIMGGDMEAADRRIKSVEDIEILPVNDEAIYVAREILTRADLSRKVVDDITHISIAAVFGMKYLVTWNCAHIANPRWLVKIMAILNELGYSLPMVCTPQALLEGE